MNMVSFTPTLIQEHLQIYDLSIAEVQESFNRFLSVVSNNATVIQSINELVSQLLIIKNSLISPDTGALVNAISIITSSVEKFCASVYFALLSLGGSNEVLKEQIMETMQCAIQCCIQLHIIGASKALFHPIINPEVTMLSSVRFLLLSVSIILEAVSYMKSEELLDEPNDQMADLQPDEVKAAVVYVLHYGRPLFKGEGQEPVEEEAPVKPVIHNNILYPNGLPPDFHLKEGETPGEQVYEDDPVDGSEELSGESKPDDPTPVHVAPAEDSFEDDPEESRPAAKAIKPAVEVKQPAVPKPADPVKVVDPPKAPEPAKVEPPKAADPGLNWADPLSLPKDVVLKLNPDSYNEQNLPPNFERPPGPTGQKPVAPKPGSVTEDEYKQWMKDKYEYETWENKLILWKIKLKRRIAEFQ